MVSNDYEAPKDMSDMPKPGEHGNRKTATIVTTTGGGTFYNADCPYCGVSMPVGRDLSIMFSCCNSCNKTYDLRHPSANEGDQTTDDLAPATTDGRPRKDDGSNTPFNPPPAKPKYPDYPFSDPRRGPQNWPINR